MMLHLSPEQERIIQEQLATGQFKSADDVFTTALERLPHSRLGSNRTAVERMIEFAKTHSFKLPADETVEGLVREIRLSQ